MESYKTKADLHAESKVKDWSRKGELSREKIKGLEKRLLDGAMTLSLQPILELKDSLEEERKHLARCETWVAHWKERL